MSSVPDWLKNRGGQLIQDANPLTSIVMLDGQPQFRLTPTPADGQFACAIVKSNNGRRLDQSGNVAPTADAALQNGLDELRRILGW